MESMTKPKSGWEQDSEGFWKVRSEQRFKIDQNRLVASE